MTTASAPAATRDARRADLRAGAIHGVALAAACYVSYWLTAHALSQVHSLSSADDKLGGAWAVIATVFVYRTTIHEDVAVAVSRSVATLVSFALCLAYLLILPPGPLGLAVLIGIGTLLLTLIGRPEDIVTAGITTAVVIGVAAISPHDAWQEPILRLADTAIGIAVGIAAALAGSKLRMPRGS
jgi:uncharacterized membrane protein YccC